MIFAISVVKLSATMCRFSVNFNANFSLFLTQSYWWFQRTSKNIWAWVKWTNFMILHRAFASFFKLESSNPIHCNCTQKAASTLFKISFHVALNEHDLSWRSWRGQIPFIINEFIFSPSLLSPLAKILYFYLCHDLSGHFLSLPNMTPMLISFFFHSPPLMVCVELFNFCERFRQTQSSWENVREFPSSCPNPNTTSEEETLHMWLHERKRRTSGEKTTHEWKYHVPPSYPTQSLWKNVFQ